MLGFSALGEAPLGDTSGGVITPGVADTTAPVMVGSITATSVTATSFTLSWPAATDNVAVTGYEVSIDGGTTYTPVSNVLTISETGLTASTAYAVRVRAYDAANNKATPLSLTVTTAAAGSTVTGVTISPTTATGSQQFTATVLGTNGPSQVVNYTTSAGSISTLGYLTISPSSVNQTATVTATSAQNGAYSATAVVTVSALTANMPSTLYLQDFFSVTMGNASSSTCQRSPCVSLIAGEYGVQFNINGNYDMSAYTALSLKFTRPDATTFTVTPTLGTIPLITPLGIFPANQYVTYITTMTDLPTDGGYQMRLTYTDVYKRVLSPVINFAVSP